MTKPAHRKRSKDDVEEIASDARQMIVSKAWIAAFEDTRDALTNRLYDGALEPDEWKRQIKVLDTLKQSLHKLANNAGGSALP